MNNQEIMELQERRNKANEFIKELEVDIFGLKEFKEVIKDARIDSELKNRFKQNVEQQIDFYEQLKDDELNALDYFNELIDIKLDNLLEMKLEENKLK
jgi:flagellar biosynthesis chaperone FliJ